MNTYLQYKDAVANVLGNTDGATDDTLRDNAINNVRRFEIANAHPFSFNETTVNLVVSNGTVALPDDYNVTHKLKDVRVVNGGASNDYISLDYDPAGKHYRLTAPSDVTLQVIYYAIPAILTADGDLCRIPDLDCVAFLAAARYWLSSETDEANHDRFKSLGQQLLGKMIKTDKQSHPQRLTRSTVYKANLGWNR